MKSLALLLLLVGRAVAGDLCDGQPDDTQCMSSGSPENVIPNCKSNACCYLGPPLGTGTGTVAASGSTITGTSTVFTAELTVGTTITIDGRSAVVTAVTSNTAASVDPGYSPTVSAGASFTYQRPILRLDSPTCGYRVFAGGGGAFQVNPTTLKGSVLIQAPAAAASTSSGNGQGGVAVEIAGQAGQSTTASGGTGGTAGIVSVSGAKGGNSSSATGTAGDGAQVLLQAGLGGDATSGSGSPTAGDAGPINLNGVHGGDCGSASCVNGDGTSINLNPGPKGTGGTGGNDGAVVVGGSTTFATELRIREASGSGSNYTGFKAPALAANVLYTMPDADGATGQVLVTDGAAAQDYAWMAIFSGGSTNATGLAADNTTTYLWAYGFNNPSTTETNQDTVFPATGTLYAATCALQTAPDNGAGTQTRTFTFRADTADKSLVCGPISETSKTCTVKSSGVAITGGQMVDWKAEATNTPAATAVTCTVWYRATDF